MKNRFTLYHLALLVLAGMSLTHCDPSLSGGNIDPEDCGLREGAPNYPRFMSKDSTYTFTTYNATGRKFKIILAREINSKLVAFDCIYVPSKKCVALTYHYEKDEKIFITYRYKHWTGLAYQSIQDVQWKSAVVSCTPKAKGTEEEEEEEDEKSRGSSVRAGISGSAGGSGSASTTVDEK